MPSFTNQNTDKTIVERPSNRSGIVSRAAVRQAREALSMHGGTPYKTDVLQRHANLQRQVLPLYCVLVCVSAFSTQFSIPMLISLLWLALGIAVSVLNYYYLSRFHVIETSKINISYWERVFLVLKVFLGCHAASLFVLHPIEVTNSAYLILVFAAAGVMMAFFLLSAWNLRFGVFFAALPVAVVVTCRLVYIGGFEAIGIAVLLVATLLFFQSLAAMMRNSYIEFLKSRAERDELIVELEESRGVSEEARRRAEDANLAKSRFLATMSHELRTPLNAILGFSEVMHKEVMGPLNNDYYKEYVGDIHRSGTHLLNLINEILDLSRVEAGRYELNEEVSNLAYIAEESQQMVKLRASEKNVSLVMQLQANLPDIWADARAIRQVVLNLLSNAIKFTPSGGTIWLKVGWTAGGGQYILIKDTGPGIPEEEIPIVLSSFGQGSIAIKSAEQGTGLGLPIVQALVQMHEGTFDLKSKLREGTEVIVTFPRKRVMEEMAAVSVEAPQPSRKNAKGFSNTQSWNVAKELNV